MTEPRVEAGDRALETARKAAAKVKELTVGDWEEYVADLIQSAMNAQERERQKTIDFLDDELGRSVAETKQFAEALLRYGKHEWSCQAECKCGWNALRERLLAERGDGI